MCSAHNDIVKAPFPSSLEIPRLRRPVQNANLEALPKSTLSDHVSCWTSHALELGLSAWKHLASTNLASVYSADQCYVWRPFSFLFFWTYHVLRWLDASCFDVGQDMERFFAPLPLHPVSFLWTCVISPSVTWRALISFANSQMLFLTFDHPGSLGFTISLW